jgi:cilia- and flagella-associated protein 52
MAASSKDHRGAVNAIAVAPASGGDAVSASSDGACIFWDISNAGTLRRRASCLSNAFFTGVAFFPDDSQTVTVGSDRKITFWDAYDGSAVRVTDGSDTAALTDVHVDAAGRMLVSAGNDGLVQLWGYDEGHCYFTGVGHSAAVNRVRISPDRLFIVSVGAEGGVFVWRYQEPNMDAVIAGCVAGSDGGGADETTAAV